MSVTLPEKRLFRVEAAFLSDAQEATAVFCAEAVEQAWDASHQRFPLDQHDSGCLFDLVRHRCLSRGLTDRSPARLPTVTIPRV